ncbi:unnamed protein product [Bursaphelenchus xylophilus]|uniref:(pine wood nematode) hypothetical protein n=1 Tax=Bursaphelenchus xylophilus TaxID=6326 RepID=A0A7I8X4P6_BURXY|nr:unnamed protein product [Bursaphelenchus xylophilus]CAG9128640.1 unnamed protein product [Bursaphelenchus xylophilus]
MWALRIVVLGCLLGTVQCKEIRVFLRENITLACPNVPSNLIRKDNIKFDFVELPAPQSFTHDTLHITDRSNKQTQLRFPGCYRVKMSFELTKPLKDPYIETFMQMGSASLPCHKVSEMKSDIIGNVCTNITNAVDWCPSSSNQRLRNMNRGKDVCRFCNLCKQASELKQDRSASLSKYVNPEGRTAECSTENQRQTLQFKICTPDRKSMHEANEEGDRELEKYWDYLKQGVFTIVVHVTDRAQPTPRVLQKCGKMCDTAENGGSSTSYRNTLQKTIGQLCAPRDEYAACLYHTMKFDVME